MTTVPITTVVEEPIRLFPQARTGHGLSDGAARQLARLGAATIAAIVVAGAVAALVSNRVSSPVSPAFSALVRPMEQAAPPAPRREGLSAPMLSTRMDYVQTFTGIVTAPSRLCETLSEAGFDSDGWRASPSGRNRWECELTYAPGPSGTGGDSTLFAMIRGAEDSGVASVFVKLNLLDPASEEDIAERAAQLLTLMRQFPDLAPPPNVIEAVAARRPIELSTYGAKFRFAAERNDPQRYNLTIRFAPRPALAARHDEL